MSKNVYDDYYMNQAGNGFSHSVFASQRGAGLGNLLGSLARAIIPVAKSTLLPAAKNLAKRAGKQLIREGARTASDVFGDVAQGHNIKDSVKARANQSKRRLVRKAKSTLFRPTINHSRKRKRAGKLVSRRRSKVSRKRDIFS